jgi:transcriptional regulator with XRE-family HTH domain
MRPNAAKLLSDAREGAGLSQRELARRARTTQSVVARIEKGLTSPGWDTLRDLLWAAGYELAAELVPRVTGRHAGRSHMLDDVARILRLTPAERLREVAAASRFIAHARRV